MVLILRQFAYRRTDLVVIPQPDGRVACIPAWMTHASATQHRLSIERKLSLAPCALYAPRPTRFYAFSDPTQRWRRPSHATVRQQDLFEADERQIAPIHVQPEQLAGLVEALLREIAAALTSGEVGDDQDHG
jgi:hypothetical protein